MNSAAATNTEPAAAWLCGLLQAGDSFYPTGSYAHSFGLEGLVQQGVVHDATTLRDFLLQFTVPALGHTDLPIIAHAWSAFAEGDWIAIGRLSALSAAMKAPQETRLASENIGRQRAELCASLHPGSLAAEYLDRARAAGWPFAATVATALEANVVGAPRVAAMTGYAYATLSALLAAAMKLLRLGQNGAQRLLTDTLASVPALVERAAGVPVDDIGWSNPWLDIAAARHEGADARMFIS